MDSNLDIFEPLELAGQSSTSNEIDSVVPDENSFRENYFHEHSLGQQNSREDPLLSEEFMRQFESECSFVDSESFFGEPSFEEEVNPCDCSQPSLVTQLSQHSYKGGWARFGLDDDPWEDEKQPTFQVLTYDDLELTKEEKDGLLTDRIVYACSSFLDKNPESQKYTLAKLVAQDKYIRDIQILEAHRYLQYIDLSHNHLQDIWPLSGVPYLMHLNVSYNELAEVLHFKAPWNLTYADFSYNVVSTINDLSDFWSLVYLDLSNNHIKKIEGLTELRYLTYLNLSMNSISCFENLNNLSIEVLDISRNLITSFEKGPGVGMYTMTNLQVLDLSCNNLTTLAIFKDVYRLKECNMEENEVGELYEIDHMTTLRQLTDLNLSGNALTQWPKYRPMVINTIRSLIVLDKTLIDTKERVSASVTFDPDVHIKTACTFAKMQLLEDADLPPSLGLDIMPFDQGPYPLVVLVGPDGSMKRNLITWIAERCPDKVYKSVCYTSRAKRRMEVDGKDYHFVTHEEFSKMARAGTFLHIDELLGDSYGFSRHEIENAVKQKKLCLTKMEILGALTLKAYGLEPTLVLTITESEDLHFRRLHGKYRASLLQLSSLSVPSSMLVSMERREARLESDHHDFADVEYDIEKILSDLLKVVTPSGIDARNLSGISDINNPEAPAEKSLLSITNSEEHAYVICLNNPSTQQVDTNDDEMHAWFNIQASQKIFTSNDSGIRAAGTSSTLHSVQSPSEHLSTRQSTRDTITLRTSSSNRSEKMSRSEDVFLNNYRSSSKSSRPMVQFQNIYGQNSDICASDSVNASMYSLQSIPLLSSMMRQESDQSQVTMDSSSVSTSSAYPMTTPTESIGCHPHESRKLDELSFTQIKYMSPEPSVHPGSCYSYEATMPLLTSSEETYMKSIINTRETYFQTHRDNPGVFAETIVTDDLEKARRKLERFIRNVYTTRPQRYPVFDITEDKAYQAMMAQRLDQFKKEIGNEQRTMAKQLDEMAKYKAPRAAPQRRASLIEKEMQEALLASSPSK